MFISKEKLNELETRIFGLEAIVNGVNKREALMLQRLDDLKELNEHLMRELKMEREAAAAYMEAHPDDPEEERKAASLRKQFDEIVNWNGMPRSVNDD